MKSNPTQANQNNPIGPFQSSLSYPSQPIQSNQPRHIISIPGGAQQAMEIGNQDPVAHDFQKNFRAFPKGEVEAGVPVLAEVRT
jgi:hypothetical protein